MVHEAQVLQSEGSSLQAPELTPRRAADTKKISQDKRALRPATIIFEMRNLSSEALLRNPTFTQQGGTASGGAVALPAQRPRMLAVQCCVKLLCVVQLGRLVVCVSWTSSAAWSATGKMWTHKLTFGKFGYQFYTHPSHFFWPKSRKSEGAGCFSPPCVLPLCTYLGCSIIHGMFVTDIVFCDFFTTRVSPCHKNRYP